MLKHVTYRSTSSLSRASSSDFSSSCRASSLSPDTCSLKGDHLSPDVFKSPSYARSPERYYPRSPDSISRGYHTPDRSYRSYHSSPECKPQSKYYARSYRTEGVTVGHRQDLDDLDGLPLGNRGSYSNSSDAVSLSSALSLASLTPRLYSRCSSTASLSGDGPTVPVKVYLRQLRPDIEYKTVSLSSHTTCRELILSLLAKFRLRHRDPKLFFITMEVIVRSPGNAAPVKHVLVLDDSARPAELQQCRPRGEARFSIGVRRGGLLRVHDSILMPGSQYKSLMVSYRTTSEDLIQLLLNCYNSKESPKHFTLHEVCKTPYSDRPISPDVYPLAIQSEWPKTGKANFSFVLRRNLTYALSLKSRMAWRRSLDQSSTDESEFEDHNTTSVSLLSGGSVSSARSSISSSSAISERSSISSVSTNSLGSSVSVSSAGSQSSALSLASSSGVSSASSQNSSPNPTPIKNKLEIPGHHHKPRSYSQSPSPKPKPLGLPPKPVPRTLFSVIPSNDQSPKSNPPPTPPTPPAKSSFVLSLASRSKSTSNLCNAIKSFTNSTLNLTSKLNSSTDLVLKPTTSTEAILETSPKYESSTLPSSKRDSIKSATSSDSILKPSSPSYSESPNNSLSNKDIVNKSNSSITSNSSNASTVTILSMIPKKNPTSPPNISPTIHIKKDPSPLSTSSPIKNTVNHSQTRSQSPPVTPTKSENMPTSLNELSQCDHSCCSHDYENCFYI